MKAKATTRSKQKKHIASWDWTTLVASWRYFEHRGTIAAAHFPIEIVERYFRGDYSDEDCEKIARQFVEVDHRNCDASEWEHGNECGRTWFKFYCFLRAWLNNSWTKIQGVDCFFCEATKRHYPKDKYISNPYVECWIDDTANGKEERK